jgi:hypothetical protein
VEGVASHESPDAPAKGFDPRSASILSSVRAVDSAEATVSLVFPVILVRRKKPRRLTGEARRHRT